jgi:hypothetical protein
MDQAKTHTRGGPRAQVLIIQHKSGIILSPLVVPTLAMTDIETGAKLGKEWRRQTLGEDVNKLRRRQDVQNVNFPNVDLVTNEVKIDLNMLHMLVLNWVGRQVDDTDIVAIDKCATR